MGPIVVHFVDIVGRFVLQQALDEVI